MALLSTFESPYYRRPATLCGPLDEGAKKYFNDLLNRNFSESHDLKKSIFDTLENCILGASSFLYNEYDPEDFYSYLNDSYAGSINETSVSEGIRLFKIQLSRKKQAQKAADDAAAQAAAYAAKMAAQIEPAEAVEEVEAVEIPEGLDVSDIIAIQEIADAQNIEQAAQIARENAAQVAEAYATGQATPEQVQAAAQVAEAVEAENTKKTLINKVLPLTLAAGLFIFLFKSKK